MKKFKLDIPHKREKGYKTWTNTSNGFFCIDLHYTADPSKDSREWQDTEFLGMSQENIQREYELNWETSADKPVYGRNFNRNLHVPSDPIKFKESLPVFRGWDFGLNQCCVVVQYYNDTVYVLKEYITEGQSSEIAVPAILRAFQRDFGNHSTIIDVIDPAGQYNEQSSESTCYKVMCKNGLAPIPGIQNPEERINSVMRLLCGLHNGKPTFQTDPGNAVLNEGFTSGYKYKKIVKGADTHYNEKPMKNEYSHIHDALQYVCTRITNYAKMMNRGFANVKPMTARYRL